MKELADKENEMDFPGVIHVCYRVIDNLDNSLQRDILHKTLEAFREVGCLDEDDISYIECEIKDSNVNIEHVLENIMYECH